MSYLPRELCLLAEVIVSDAHATRPQLAGADEPAAGDLSHRADRRVRRARVGGDARPRLDRPALERAVVSVGGRDADPTVNHTGGPARFAADRVVLCRPVALSDRVDGIVDATCDRVAGLGGGAGHLHPPIVVPANQELVVGARVGAIGANERGLTDVPHAVLIGVELVGVGHLPAVIRPVPDPIAIGVPVTPPEGGASIREFTELPVAALGIAGALTDFEKGDVHPVTSDVGVGRVFFSEVDPHADAFAIGERGIGAITAVGTVADGGRVITAGDHGASAVLGDFTTGAVEAILAVDAVGAVVAILTRFALGPLRTLGAVLTVLAGADRGGAGFPADHDHAPGAVGLNRARSAVEAVRAVLTVDTIAAILAVGAISAVGTVGAVVAGGALIARDHTDPLRVAGLAMSAVGGGVADGGGNGGGRGAGVQLGAGTLRAGGDGREQEQGREGPPSGACHDTLPESGCLVLSFLWSWAFCLGVLGAKRYEGCVLLSLLAMRPKAQWIKL